MRGLLANWLWLLIFGALVSGFMVGGWSASQEAPSQHQNKWADDTQARAGVKPTPVSQPHAEEGTPKAEEKEKHSIWTWITSFFEIKLTDAIIAFFTVVLAVKTSGLFVETAGLRSAADQQAKDMQDSIVAAKQSAEAARISAEAFMNAEGAQIFPVIVEDNLREVLRGDSRYFIPSESPDILLLPPKISYRFKNYGKTPAKLQSIMHNISFLELNSKSRLMHAADDFPLEIIGGDKDSSKLECAMLDHFKIPMAQAAVEYRAELMFYGEAVFTDFFDRQFRCIWECDCRSGEAKLTYHEQRLDPDKK